MKENKMKKIIHDNCFGNYGCNPDVEADPKYMTMIHTDVTCIKCLKLIIKEWKRQITFMKHQPLKNAIEGLKVARKRLKEIKSN